MFFQVFTRNSGSPNKIVYNRLNEPILARYIRVVPVVWIKRITMRVEIYGCRGTLLFIISILKSLVVPAIWLAFSIIVSSRVLLFFSFFFFAFSRILNLIISLLTCSRSGQSIKISIDEKSIAIKWFLSIDNENRWKLID